METASDTVVMQFGGTSVGDPERIRGVARRLVEARERGVRVVGTGRVRETVPRAGAAVRAGTVVRVFGSVQSR